MEHCKKLVLVPHETLSRLHDKPMSRTGSDVMGELDSDMHKILLKKAEDSEKWKLYHQTLQRYLHFVNEQRKPLEISLPSINEDVKSDKTDNNNDDRLQNQLISVIPKKFKNTAMTLFHTLASQEDKSLLAWDSAGLVKIKDTPIPQSNIIDLISDAVRNRKTSQAAGWKSFASVLKQLHVPMDLISNTQYKQFIRTQSGNGVTSIQNETRHTEPDPRSSTSRHRPAPPSRAKIKSRRQSIKKKNRTPKGWSSFWSSR